MTGGKNGGNNVAAWIPFRGSEQEHILLDILCLASKMMQEQ